MQPILPALVLAASSAAAGDPAPDAVVSSPFALAPRGVTSFGAVADGGWLYTLGGYFGTPHDYVREDQSRSFLRLDLYGGTWEELPFDEPIQSVALAAHGGRVYRVGGLTVLNARGAPEHLESLDAFARYDPLAGAWEPLAPLPEPRSSHEATLLGDTLYVGGGWRLDGDERAWAETLLATDLASETPAWRAIPAPFKRRALAVAAAGGRVWAIGGIDANGQVTGAVDVYDPAAESWSVGPEFPDFGFGVAAVGAGDTIWASGRSGVVYRLSAGASSWERAGELLFARFFHQLVRAGDALLAVGGIAEDGRVRQVERLASPAAEPGPRVTRWTVPAPAAARADRAFARERSVYFAADGWRLDLATLGWERIAAPAEHDAPLRLALRADAKLAYALASDALSTYSFTKDRWRPAAAPLPSARAGSGLARRGDELWIVGGSAGGAPALELLRWDPSGDAGWIEAGVALPRARSSFAHALVGERLVLAGGAGADGEPIASCDVLDFASGGWSDLAAPAGQVLALVTLGERLVALHVAGGAPRLAALEHGAERWEPLDVSFEGLREPRAFEHRGRVLVVSSAAGPGERVDVVLVDAGGRQP